MDLFCFVNELHKGNINNAHNTAFMLWRGGANLNRQKVGQGDDSYKVETKRRVGVKAKVKRNVQILI